jgi:hypothetical protein
MRLAGRTAVVLLAVAASFLAACNGSSQTSSNIGSVTRLQGEGTLTRGSSSSPLAAEVQIQRNDAISTGAATRAELTFEDGTKLTVGEQSRVKIDTFVFDEKASGNKLGLSVTGPFRFVSGKLTKGYGAEASVTTPMATIGIRGTDFWGGPIDNQFGVFLIEGSVSVTTPAGQVVLTATGSGVNVPAPGQAPGEITQWPQEKVDRAIATVTFQ